MSMVGVMGGRALLARHLEWMRTMSDAGRTRVVDAHVVCGSSERCDGRAERGIMVTGLTERQRESDGARGCLPVCTLLFAVAWA